MTAVLSPSETTTPTATSPDAVVAQWLTGFSAASESGDRERLASLLVESGWWRDLLAFTWDIRSFVGAELAAEAFVGHAQAGPLGVVPGSVRAEGVPGDPDQVTAFFDLDLPAGRGRGFVRLLRVGDAGATGSWRALALLTQLEEIRGLAERVGSQRPLGTTHGPVPGREPWSHVRRREAAFEEAEPAVLVVGGGHSGLAIAARLGRLGVPTLVVEQNARVGDNWRRRYPSLTLHDPVGMDHLPYLPFPESWPTYSPKDKFAGWLEYYAEAMELNVWTDTELVGVERDADGVWSARVRRGDGSVRVLRPRHVVMATGINGRPALPDVPGADQFAGVVTHSSAFEGGEEWRGRRAVVVGAGVSGHDVAQNLCEHGAEVTLVQRSSTYVVRSETWYSTMMPFYLDGGPPTADADMIAGSVPFGLAPTLAVEPTRLMAEQDADLLDRLRARGFALDAGPDGQGLMGKFLSGIEGYYIDVGAAELIAEGRIAVHQGAGLARFTSDGVELDDGVRLPADLVVLATGYHGVLDTLRPVLGAAADACVPVFGVASDGEMSGSWRHSGQDGLWFMVGNLQMARVFSRPLALRIAAIEAGLVDPGAGFREA